jgi:predicted DsbA family dithiol-disulfide isomerase
MHDRAAGSPTLPDAAALRAMASAAGVDGERFARCLARPETTEAVAALSTEAERLGLMEPPAVLVDGLVFGGMQSAERLLEAALLDESRGPGR